MINKQRKELIFEESSILQEKVEKNFRELWELLTETQPSLEEPSGG